MFNALDTNVHYETIAENVSNGILLENSDRKIKYVNSLFLEIFDITAKRENLIGTDCNAALRYAAFLFAQPYEFLNRTDICLAQGKKVFNEEWMMADGRFFLRDYIPIYEQGSITGHLWMYKEVTELKKLEEDNKKLKLFYERILDNIPVEIAVFDVGRKFLYVNQTAVPNHGTRNWMIGKKAEDFYKRRPDLASKEKVRSDIFLRALVSGEKQEYIERHDLPGRRVKYDLRSAYPIAENRDEADLVITCALDITSLIEKENELKDTNSKLDSLINALDEALVIVGPSYNIEYANPSWERIFEVTREESIGNKVHQFFGKEAADSLSFIFKEIEKERKEHGRIKLEIINRFFTKKVISCYITPFSHENTIKFSCLFTDITAIEKSVEELNRLFLREKDLNEMKTGFVNMVSHELRTPLSIIQSSAEICEIITETALRGSENVFKQYLENIKGEVERITKLLSEVLLVSKMEAGKIKKNCKNIDLHYHCLSLIEKSFLPWGDNRSLVYKIDVKEELFTDIMMVEHIVSNILQNAFKYSPNRPSPICRIKQFKNFWCFTVIDFGIGISAQDVNSLGQPFFRGVNSGDIGGTGLGLSIVKYFISQLNGSLYIRSILNKGSVFYIKFPYEKSIDS